MRKIRMYQLVLVVVVLIEKLKIYLIAIKLIKSQKSNLTKSKKPDLVKTKFFVKINTSKTDFLISEAKNVFIYL